MYNDLSPTPEKIRSLERSKLDFDPRDDLPSFSMVFQALM